MNNNAEKIYLGNVITMDFIKPKAQAVAVKDGKICMLAAKKMP